MTSLLIEPHGFVFLNETDQDDYHPTVRSAILLSQEYVGWRLNEETARDYAMLLKAEIDSHDGVAHGVAFKDGKIMTWIGPQDKAPDWVRKKR